MSDQNKSIYYQNVVKSAEALSQWHGGEKAPDYAIVLGSGLSNIIPNYKGMKSISYSEIPGFHKPKVPGHSGEIRIGNIGGVSDSKEKIEKKVVFLQGRNHAYEGYNPAEVVHNIRSLIHWGVKGIILTNAAGCLNKNWELGKMMLITDHINLTGITPLLSDYGRDFGPQFVDMSNAYDLSWQVQFKSTASRNHEVLYSGVYCGVLGPQYETPAEIHMMQTYNGSAVGMSTVLETIAAKQMGVKVAGISCLTNYAAGLHPSTLNHVEVMDMGNKFASNMSRIVLNTIANLEV